MLDAVGLSVWLWWNRLLAGPPDSAEGPTPSPLAAAAALLPLALQSRGFLLEGEDFVRRQLPWARDLLVTAVLAPAQGNLW